MVGAMRYKSILETQRLQFREKTGLCPVCKSKSALNGITCKDLECIEAWIHNRVDPCVGLVNYGIQNYECDIVVHVCYQAGELWAYTVTDGMRAIESGRYPKRAAYQYIDGEKVRTAGGYLVPPKSIPAHSREIPKDILASHRIHNGLDTSTKGRYAQEIVSYCLARGVFPTPLINSDGVIDRDAQLRGNDLVVTSVLGTIQVKCDLPGGSRERGGTGNLFLQTCEINPDGRH